MAPKLSTSTIGYKSITVRFAWHVTRATQWRAAPRSSRKCWPHFWCFKAITFVLLSLNTASLLLLLKSNSLHFFYFLLSTLFNYTVRLMAPGMRVCKKKKITSARLNNYSPLFNHHHHHHQYITSNKKEKRNKNESSRYRLRETEIKLLPLLSCDYLQNRFDK